MPFIRPIAALMACLACADSLAQGAFVAFESEQFRPLARTPRCGS